MAELGHGVRAESARGRMALDAQLAAKNLPPTIDLLARGQSCCNFGKSPRRNRLLGKGSLLPEELEARISLLGGLVFYLEGVFASVEPQPLRGFCAQFPFLAQDLVSPMCRVAEPVPANEKVNRWRFAITSELDQVISKGPSFSSGVAEIGGDTKSAGSRSR